MAREQVREIGRVLLGVSGSVAAYKAAELVRLLRAREMEVQVVMSPNAARFIGAATLQALSGRPVRDDLWDPAAEAAMGHIELARWADLILVAPASADRIACLAGGRADDLLGACVLASEAPLWLAPAMNQAMYRHPATRENLDRLRARGVRILGPEAGEQACGETGPGRLMEPAAIVEAVVGAGPAPAAPPTTGALAGRRVLVTAGPTHEPLDPVRYLANRSSGRMGYAVAEAARDMGARVTLVSGPVALATPPGVERVDVETAAQMHEAVMRRIGATDLLIAAAAVADYRPVRSSAAKIKKTAASLELTLEPTADIIAGVARCRPRPFLVGFAAETEDVAAHARAKLEAKGLDMIAANQVGPGLGMGTADNALEVMWPGGSRLLERAPKRLLARRLMDLVAERYLAEDRTEDT